MDANDWIDPYPDHALDQLRDALGSSAPANVRDYVLLDMGFSPLLRDELPSIGLHGTVVALYEGVYEGDDLLPLSPCLMALPDLAAQRDEVCAGLLARTGGRPMFSLLRTTYQAGELASHLQKQLEARTEDGEAFLVRFADTRCLPVWARALSAVQRARFFAGIEAWWIFDRTGTLVPVDAPATPASSGRTDSVAREAVVDETKPYQLDARQLELLRQTAKVDTIIFHIRQRPDTFGMLMGSPSQIHACVSAALAGELPSPSAASRVALSALEVSGLLVEE